MVARISKTQPRMAVNNFLLCRYG